MDALRRGAVTLAWDRFIDRYRRLIMAIIRRYATDRDEAMDLFAHVCAALNSDNLVRLRRYAALAPPRPRCATWLVTVVRHLIIDWYRHRDGRRRLSTLVERLPPLEGRVFELVFHEGRSHVEAFETLTSRGEYDQPFPAFLRLLRATYEAVRALRPGMLMRELAPPLPPVPAIEPADPAVVAERRALLAEALALLDDRDRLAVQLYVLDDLPAAEVARLVGYPSAKTVYNRAYRALQTMRTHLCTAGLQRADL